MGKAPAFQFYVKDWLSDPELQCVSASSRGMWIDALCYMWQAPERGRLTATEDELSKLLRATNGDFHQFMEDLKRHKFADVTNCNNEITIVNRRMFREEKDRENTRLRVRRFRSNAESNKDVTPPSPSPSPSPSPKNKEKIARSDKPKRAIMLADQDFIEALKANPAYSGIDIDRELGKIDAWLLTPRGRGKKKTQQRVVNWLNKADRPMEDCNATNRKDSAPPLDPIERRLWEAEKRLRPT